MPESDYDRRLRENRERHRRQMAGEPVDELAAPPSVAEEPVTPPSPPVAAKPASRELPPDHALADDVPDDILFGSASSASSPSMRFGAPSALSESMMIATASFDERKAFPIPEDVGKILKGMNLADRAIIEAEYSPRTKPGEQQADIDRILEGLKPWQRTLLTGELRLNDEAKKSAEQHRAGIIDDHVQAVRNELGQVPVEALMNALPSMDESVLPAVAAAAAIAPLDDDGLVLDRGHVLDEDGDDASIFDSQVRANEMMDPADFDLADSVTMTGNKDDIMLGNGVTMHDAAPRSAAETLTAMKSSDSTSPDMPALEQPKELEIEPDQWKLLTKPLAKDRKPKNVVMIIDTGLGSAADIAGEINARSKLVNKSRQVVDSSSVILERPVADLRDLERLTRLKDGAASPGLVRYSVIKNEQEPPCVICEVARPDAIIITAADSLLSDHNPAISEAFDDKTRAKNKELEAARKSGYAERTERFVAQVEKLSRTHDAIGREVSRPVVIYSMTLKNLLTDEQKERLQQCGATLVHYSDVCDSVEQRVRKKMTEDAMAAPAPKSGGWFNKPKPPQPLRIDEAELQAQISQNVPIVAATMVVDAAIGPLKERRKELAAAAR